LGGIIIDDKNMMNQRIIYQCSLCGYISSTPEEICPVCRDGQGSSWPSDKPWDFTPRIEHIIPMIPQITSAQPNAKDQTAGEDDARKA